MEAAHENQTRLDATRSARAADADRSHGTPIASIGSFTLFDRGTGTNGWTNLKVVDHTPREDRWDKRNFWLAWNGDRFANCKDIATLRDKHPNLPVWIIERLRARWSE